MEVRQKLVFDGLEIVKALSQTKTDKNPRNRKEEVSRSKVHGTEEYQDGNKKTEGILRKNLAIGTAFLNEVDSGKEDFHNARNKEDDTSKDGKDRGGSISSSEDEEDEEYTGKSMSQDTNNQASTNLTSLNDHKEEEDEDMSAIESIQADLDTLIWENHQEKELQITRQEGYRIISNPLQRGRT